MTTFSTGELIGLVVFVLVVVAMAFLLLRLNAAMETPTVGDEASEDSDAAAEVSDEAKRALQRSTHRRNGARRR